MSHIYFLFVICYLQFFIRVIIADPSLHVLQVHLHAYYSGEQDMVRIATCTDTGT